MTWRRVAEDHAVRPVLVVLVELGLVDALGDAVEVGEEVWLRLLSSCSLLAWSGAADRRSAPWGGPFPGCRAAARGRRGRTSPAHPCRARRAAGRGRGSGARRRPESASWSSSSITDWYSAVGMFFRVASSCLRASTCFGVFFFWFVSSPLSGYPSSVGSAALIRRARRIRT